MRYIKVTYRAVFAQPIGVLNPSGLRMAGSFPVEIFVSGSTWKARDIQTADRRVYTKLDRFSSAEDGKQKVQESFERQIEPWQVWSQPHTPLEIKEGAPREERLIEPGEIQLLADGKVLWKEDDDYLHIIHAPTLRAGERIPHAACGAKVKAESFINNKANVRPTCKACALVWEQHYKNA